MPRERNDQTAIFHSDAFREPSGEKIRRENLNLMQRNEAISELTRTIELNNGRDPSDSYFDNEFFRYDHFNRKIEDLIKEVSEKYGGSPEGLDKLKELEMKNPREAVSRAKLVKAVKEKYSALKKILAELKNDKYENAIKYVSKRERDLSEIMEGFYDTAGELITKYKTRTRPTTSRIEALRKIKEMGQTTDKVSEEDLKKAERAEVAISEWEDLKVVMKVLELKQVIKNSK